MPPGFGCGISAVGQQLIAATAAGFCASRLAETFGFVEGGFQGGKCLAGFFNLAGQFLFESGKRGFHIGNALILRDRNRASVIIWSVGNENADTDERLNFMTSLVNAARDADPSRLISAACLVNHAKMKIEDRLTDFLDIIGLNEYYGWYEENFDDLIVLGKNSSPTKPVVITETGAEGVLSGHAPKTGPFSEHYMAEVYRKQTEYLPKLNYVRGFTPWLLYDYRTERRQNPWQQGFNCKGLITADKKTRKAAFYVLRDFYETLKKADPSSH